MFENEIEWKCDPKIQIDSSLFVCYNGKILEMKNSE